MELKEIFVLLCTASDELTNDGYMDIADDIENAMSKIEKLLEL